MAILVAGCAGPTWDRYVPALRDWPQFAAANGFTALPAEPAEFHHFLATRAEADTGSALTKMRICAMNAASQLAEVPPPSGDATVGAFRRGVRRVKRAARCPVRLMFRGDIPAPEMPQDRLRARAAMSGFRARGSRLFDRSGCGPRRVGRSIARRGRQLACRVRRKTIFFTSALQKADSRFLHYEGRFVEL